MGTSFLVCFWKVNQVCCCKVGVHLICGCVKCTWVIAGRYMPKSTLQFTSTHACTAEKLQSPREQSPIKDINFPTPEFYSKCTENDDTRARTTSSWRHELSLLVGYDKYNDTLSAFSQTDSCPFCCVTCHFRASLPSPFPSFSLLGHQGRRQHPSLGVPNFSLETNIKLNSLLIKQRNGLDRLGWWTNRSQTMFRKKKKDSAGEASENLKTKIFLFLPGKDPFMFFTLPG